LIALCGAALVLKPTHRGGSGFDPLGALLSVVGLFCLSLALSRAHVWGWDSPLTLGLISGALVVIAVFLIVERRVAAPTLDLALFGNRLFALSVLAAFLYFVSISGLIFILPLAAQTALGYTPFLAGLLLMPITALNVVLAPTAGALSDRIPVRYVSTFGAVVVAIGLFVISRLPPIPLAWEIVAAMVLTGFGTAVFSQPNNSAIMGSAPPKRRGIAAGTLATARTTGQLLGVATSGAVYFLLVQREAGAHTFAPASTYFGLASLLMLIVAAISWIRE
jgi:nitrate/nitrite transporter NarK